MVGVGRPSDDSAKKELAYDQEKMGREVHGIGRQMTNRAMPISDTKPKMVCERDRQCFRLTEAVDDQMTTLFNAISDHRDAINPVLIPVPSEQTKEEAMGSGSELAVWMRRLLDRLHDATGAIADMTERCTL